MRPELSNGQSHFWQWDTGQKIKVDGAAKELHYIDIDGAVEVGEDGWADVPDELLQKSGTLLGWAYLTDHTIERFAVGVSPRSKPPDYVYTPTEVKTWEELRDRLEELEKSGVPPETLKAAVESYLQANPVKETDPTVPAWAKAPEKPTYTADEVGALSANSLQTATNAALAQAKASGAFDGPKGDPGKDGAGLTVTGATVGQIVKIAAVDEAGTPTAWEPVDMIGGGQKWELLGQYTFAPKDRKFEVALSQYDVTRFRVIGHFPKTALGATVCLYVGTKLNHVRATYNQSVYAFNFYSDLELIGGQLYGFAGTIDGWTFNPPISVACITPRDTGPCDTITVYYTDAVDDETQNTLEVWGYK